MTGLTNLVFDNFGSFITEFGLLLAIPIGASAFGLVLGVVVNALRGKQ